MQQTPQTPANLNDFYESIINWYHCAKYPQVLIDDIMKTHPAESLGPFLNATPETVARVFTKEYAIDNELIYQVEPDKLIKQVKRYAREY